MCCFGLPSKCTKQGFSISRLHLESRKDMWSSGRVVQRDATHQGWTLVSHLFSRFFSEKAGYMRTCAFGALLQKQTSLPASSLPDFKKPTVIVHHCRFFAKTDNNRINWHWYSGLHCRFISLLVLAKKRQWYWVITAGFSQEPTLILSMSVRGLNRQWYTARKLYKFLIWCPIKMNFISKL